MKNLVLIAFLSLLLGCGKDNDEVDTLDLHQDGDEIGLDPKPDDTENKDWCSIWHSERQIVEELEEVEGKVVQLKKCSGSWVLTGSSGTDAPGRQSNYLNTCNLPEEFKVDGAEIILSGYVYGHTDDEELLSFCAQPFKITC